MTVSGEEIIEKNWQGQPIQTLGRRKTKVYSDILGREYKTEVLNWDGSVYSSSTTVFDGADRPTFARQFQGNAFLNNQHQTTSFTYDGFGRLKTEHIPQQDTYKYTSYTYFPDDKIQSRTDARGATTHNVYNSFGLIENTHYSVPAGSNMEVVKFSDTQNSLCSFVYF
jgi:YD repeat-containing protein